MHFKIGSALKISSGLVNFAIGNGTYSLSLLLTINKNVPSYTAILRPILSLPLGDPNMPHQPDASDVQSWHKRFASMTNNRAWELTLLHRTAAQDSEMLDAAHASAWHWAAVGTELNAMRSAMLLAEVYAGLGNGPVAVAYAERMHSFFISRETEDWEVAFAHAIKAHAASVAGSSEVHRAAYQEAVITLSRIKDDEDRAIVMKTFALVPKP
jgi:hypothetical protein